MTMPPDSETIAGELLAFARAQTGRSDLGFAATPERFPGGEDTASYGFTFAGAPAPLDGALVLRLFAGRAEALEVTAARARFESAVHGVVTGLGYPAPRVRFQGDAATIGGAHFLLIERVPGDSLWSRLRPPSQHTFGAGSLLAEAQARLHALDPAPLEVAVAAIGDPARLHPERMLDWTEAEIDARVGAAFRLVWEWLRAHHRATPAPAICHADFHPVNVIVDGMRFVGAVDWADVQIADPHFDVAQTLVILLFAHLDAPPRAARALDAMRRSLAVQYRRAYHRHRPLDEERLAYFEAFAITRRLVQAAAAQRAGRTTAWGHPDVRRRLAARLRGLTGVETDGGSVNWV